MCSPIYREIRHVLLVRKVLVDGEKCVKFLGRKNQERTVLYPSPAHFNCGFDIARIIHERFCCNRGFAAATSLDAVTWRPGRRARRLVDQHTVSSMPHFRAALRACLAWRLRDFATNRHE